jgi:predicted patatin/cPLA2 family phospholipase
MGELPKRFPEYSLMYKTILNQIKKLEDIKSTPENKNEIQIKIKNYKIELDKIKKMFPENFFDN